MIGERYGKLLVIGYAYTKRRKSYWMCQCDCGNRKIIRKDSLTTGRVKACGCQRNRYNIKQLENGERIHSIYNGMKQRCYNPHNKNYHRYGGRGITICKEWVDDFMNFYSWSVLHGYADDLTIDRINNDGNYEPSNCRWATWEEQAKNKGKTAFHPTD